jgi:hypothetical protein
MSAQSYASPRLSLGMVEDHLALFERLLQGRAQGPRRLVSAVAELPPAETPPSLVVAS